MSSTSGKSRREELRQALSAAALVECGEVDVEAACASYLAEGYGVASWLRSFLEDYGEIRVTWKFNAKMKVVLTTAALDMIVDPDDPSDREIVGALAADVRSVRIFEKELGRGLVPIGMFLDLQDYLLLSAAGEVFLLGIGGIQYIGTGFEDAIKKLIDGNWDKNFYWSLASFGND